MSGPREKSAIPYSVCDVRGFLQTCAAKCATCERGSRSAKSPYSTRPFPHTGARGTRVEGVSLLPLTLCPSRSVRGKELGPQNCAPPSELARLPCQAS
jgi:hypothetical protein